MHRKQLLLFLAALVLGALPLRAQIPAFPGAEGFGAYARGGRGGDVYYVNNLNTSGTGSFAEAIATAPSSGRTIVFGVSGYIHVNKTSVSKSKVTIAGQTAPGDGIGFKDGSFIIAGNDVVIRHARFRYGKQTAGGDCINVENGVTNLIFDHVSLAFSTDENISSFSQSPRPDLTTFQWSLNAWGLETHSCGGLWDWNRVTTHHTLWAHHKTRNPKARPDGLLDWINNVTFDWGIGFIMGDSTTPASWKANVRGNYFVCPPGNLRSVALEKASIDRNGAYNFTLHVSTNLFDKNGDGVLNGSDYGYGIASGSYQVSNAPIVVAGAQVPVAIDLPLTAYKKIVSQAGPLRMNAHASIPLRDEVDTILINNLVTQRRHNVTNETQTGASNGGMGYLNSTPAPKDTDLDGMPDLWESSLGWSVASQDHNTALANSGGYVTGLTFLPPNTPAGYTRLEEYLHFLTLPHLALAKNTASGPTSFSVDLRRYASGFNKAPVAFTFSAVSNGVVVLQPDGYTAVFTPTLDFSGRARFNFTVTDGDGSTWTQTFGVLVTSTALPRDLKWKGDGSANLWNTNAPNFLLGTNLTAFVPGDNVRFDDSGSNTPNINLPFALAPSEIEVDATKNYSFLGPGAIAGSGALTKTGSGTLTFGTTNNACTGPIDLAEGTLTLLNGTSLGSGQLTLRGGATFNLASGGNTFPANPIFIPADDSGTITSGSLGTSLSGAITGGGTSLLNLGGSVSFGSTAQQFAGFPGTVVLPAGATLRFANTSGGNGGAGTLFQVNGTLQPRNAGLTVTLGALAGSGTLTGQQTPPPSGGTGNVTYSIGGRGTDTTFSGTLVDSNSTNRTSLTKVGSATLTLTGTNSCSGPTTVSAGTLTVNGTMLSSPVTVASSATLAGTGRLGGLLTVSSGGRIAPGNSGTGTLTASNGVTLNTATLLFDLARSPDGYHDKIALQGGLLTLSGAQTFQFTLADGQLFAGTYTLIEGGTNTSASSVSFVHNLPTNSRQGFALQRPASGNGQCYVRLVVSGDPTTLVWRGLVNTNWDLASSNWVNGAAADRFVPFDSVRFDDTSAALPLINIPSSANPARISVTASTTRTFAGAGSLAGSGPLTKTGAGTLVISTTNSSYAGSIILAGGALSLTAGATLGTGNLTLLGGATLNLPPSSPAYFYGGTITVPAGHSGTISSPGLGNGFTGKVVSGSANSVLYIANGVSFTGTGSWQFDDFTGAIHILPGGTLRFSEASSGNVFGSLQPTFVINGTLRPRNAGNTIRLGALSGSGTITGQEKPPDEGGSGNVTYNIGGNHTDAIFSGTISDAHSTTNPTALIKSGTGKLTLGGSSSYSAGTTVEAGALIVNNTTGSGTGTGGLSIAGGATLGGTGFIGSATTLEDYAALSPGSSDPGTLTFNGDLELGEFTLLNFQLGASSDRVVANGALTLQGTLNVTPLTVFGPGIYTLFTYNPAKTFNNSGIDFGAIPSGYNYAINTATPGQVKLIVSPTTPPSFSGISVSDGSVILSGSGGTPGANYFVRGTTNIVLPFANWTRLVTNQFDSFGNFIWTNTPAAGRPQQFYRLELP